MVLWIRDLALPLHLERVKRPEDMKNTQKIAALTLTMALIGTTIYLLKKKKEHRKRLAVVSNAGYEMAYDVHFPVRYKKPGGRAVK
jgi:hypothetical protein